MMDIADRVENLMRKDGVTVVVRGDGLLVDAYASDGRQAPHPLIATDRAIAALERSPKFTKRLVRAHDIKARPRTVRAFWLNSAD